MADDPADPFPEEEYQRILRENPELQDEIDKSWADFKGRLVTCKTNYSVHLIDKPGRHRCTTPIMSAWSDEQSPTVDRPIDPEALTQALSDELGYAFPKPVTATIDAVHRALDKVAR